MKELRVESGELRCTETDRVPDECENEKPFYWGGHWDEVTWSMKKSAGAATPADEGET